MPVNIISSWPTEVVARTRRSARMVMFGQGRYNLKRFQYLATNTFAASYLNTQGLNN